LRKHFDIEFAILQFERSKRTTMPTKINNHTSPSRPSTTPRQIKTPTTSWTWSLSRPTYQRLIFSTNYQKAWCEQFFLQYSLVWPVLFGLWSISGWHLQAGDFGNVFVSIIIGSPFLIIPWLYQPNPLPDYNDDATTTNTTKGRQQPFHQTYAFKFNLWIAIYACIASFFFTEYFFDVLGMKYSFPHLKWNLDSVVLGQGFQRVPIMMYIHGWYFFMTYHTGGVCFIRLIRNVALSTGLMNEYVASAGATFIGAMVFSAGEIYFTTLDAIKDQFAYRDMKWALSWGALAYSCYFIASFPMVKDMDENGFEFWKKQHFTIKSAKYVGNRTWSIQQVIEKSLAAGMVSFFLLEIACQVILPSTWYHEKGWWNDNS
jgi:cycloeucalenol cycloisomerase